ncbi:hypothetical protein A2230_06015 [candidate division WOR-1 bacterium RIFOXYA2_FULL_36_21]|uniref:Uncharacterized protein n=1 Tax=candidate division WOR-1 bacterium RIFOXYB2_FULL_36_35 TaxID=1802578 RepID=A0A1F4S0T7_UNCSA|nr:MAG: hypothetical protein A2230_06015 [candidate division WOR-1 bacterium RIFOXYA2_FULL_36_21]OGC14051.1 MAG: hypothetical protein A2290_02935 [candidate division WOR-1 bacterium RIFOXYB2_FULL_36_35]
MKHSKIVLIIFAVSLAAFSGLLIQILISIPKIEKLETYIPSEATILFSSDNEPLARFHKEENRRVVSLSRMSPYIKKATVAIEDERFYSHHGIDIRGIMRATIANITRVRLSEGASTITQQLARNLFLTRKKNIIRKLAEVILAFQIERRFTKQEILEYYLNQIYFGHNAYGIESASYLYFNKHAKDLTLAESAMIAGIIEGPEIYSPYKNLKLAKNQQRIVLLKMVDLSMISLTEARISYNETLNLHPENLKKFGNLAPYFVNYIFQELIKKFGEEAVNKGGLKVYTTLDTNMQANAEESVDSFIEREGSKYNFSQASLLAIDPRNGHIKAMVGGADFVKSQFNRTIQSRRQPGSSFKPFIYATAIEKGISPGTVIKDEPTIFEVFRNKWNPSGKWTPQNFNGRFSGNVTMQYALEKSLNIPAIKTLDRVGIPSVINMARKLGIKSHLEPALSLALGASEVTMLEITSAFGVFANEGIRYEPTAITKIVDRNGNTIFISDEKGEQVIDSNVANIIAFMMQRVLTNGTGIGGRLNRPAAAKTGTSQDFKDAWLIGFTPQLVTGVWVGNDDNKPMKGVAEVSVCPRMWKDFMTKALAYEPPLNFSPPVGLYPYKICLDSGLVATSYCPKNRTVDTLYFEEDAPKADCNIHIFETVENQEDEKKQN